jgi:threonine aldolase
MRSFASDNYSGICDEVMQALQEANQAHASSYGNDSYTAKAQALLRMAFGEHILAYFVYNGTAANTLALKAITKSHHAIIATDCAHIATQEVGAPTSWTGCSMLTAPNSQGKLTPTAIEQAYRDTSFWGRHSVLPKVVSISQTTEYGTVYTLDELKAIAHICHTLGLYLHMDGSRLANAAAALGVSLKDLTIGSGVDVFSFGGTKNGLLFGEVIVFANSQLAQEFEHIQKQGLQLHSKMRFLTAQFIPYIDKQLWLRNAAHANAMCKLLAQGLATLPQAKLAFPCQSNQLFIHLPQAVIEATQVVFPYYVWHEQSRLVRLVCSFDTTAEEIQQFIEIAELASRKAGCKP